MVIIKKFSLFLIDTLTDKVFIIFIAALLITTCIHGIYGSSANNFLYARSSILALTLQHLIMVILSSAASIIVGVSCGILVTRKSFMEFMPIANTLSSIAQTFPPVAVLALCVPIFGFGMIPTILALFLYGIFPILRNTISGIESVPFDIKEAAKGMGMTDIQVVTKVEIPVALDVILAGIRTSVIINIGTATIGATIGAGGLGAPIISGLINNNFYYVAQGSIFAGLMAVTADRIIRKASVQRLNPRNLL